MTLKKGVSIPSVTTEPLTGCEDAKGLTVATGLLGTADELGFFGNNLITKKWIN